MTVIGFNILCSIPSFNKIGQFFTEIWRFNDFQNGGRPPSWILKIVFVMQPVSACRSASSYKISLKSDNRSMSYGQKAIFKMAAAAILNLKKIHFVVTWLWFGSISAVVYQILSKSDDFYRAMICKRSLCCHAVSVRPSDTFVDHVKTNKHIFEIFSPSPSGSDTSLVFPYQRGCRYSDGKPPNGGVECKGIW